MQRRPAIRARLAAAIVVAASVTASSQQPPTQTGATLSGRVVDAATGQGVRGAIVGASAVRANEPGFITGADGRFILRNIPPGTVNFYATKGGYFEGFYGRRRPGSDGEQLRLQPGETIENTELLIWPIGMISGTVVNEAGEPMPRMMIQARRVGELDPAKQLHAQADNSGRYQIDNVPPGDYVVSIGTSYDSTREQAIRNPPIAPATQGRPLTAYQGKFYPSADRESDATIVSLAAGEDRTAIDFRLEPVAAYRVTGRLADTLDDRVAIVSLEGTATMVTGQIATGEFVLPVVPQGTYTLRVASMPAGQMGLERLFGVPLPVTVTDRNIEGLRLQRQPGVSVAGSVVSSPQIDTHRLSIRLETAVMQPAAAAASAADGRFLFRGVGPGRYFLRLHEWPAGTVIESVDLGGRDITDAPLEVANADVSELSIRLASPAAAISGQVRDAMGRATASAAIVLFPSDRSLWGGPRPQWPIRFRRTRPSRGAFNLDGLSPGEYYLIAVDDALLDAWPQAELLSRLVAGAERVSVAAGDRLQRSLVMRDR